ncbi:hypothetical protein [Xanthomarina spongicola]|uniref:Neuromedin U n=1 Tax=Xanthomarina spongicola TaxID=570520 RepID=A0A316DNA5_9FLAO|nr:hypothetical protein [Xanthomarina spongicola]PWK19657.1 hypothetical protein LX78_01006 [Xanthomarina spongicola]
MKKMLKIQKYLLLFMMLFSALINAQEAQETQEKPSADELAKELANPNTVRGTLNFNFDYVHYQGDLPGAESQNSFVMGFQPVLPLPLNKTTNLFVRPNIPLYFTQPTYGANGFENQGVGLGNISADIAIGKTFPSKTIGILGVFGSFRTASSEALRSPYTLLGPEIMVAQLFNWGVVGIMVNHSWNVNKIDPTTNDSFSILGDDVWIASEGGDSASITAGQYFYAVSLSNGWQIMSGPTWSYNHNASKGNKLTLPLATGVTKVTNFGKLPIKFNMQYWYFVASPEAFGPQHQIRLTISPVVPLPW